ncbi:hypothetical protein ACWEQ0_06490 [Nocardia thailandica]
MVVLVVPSPLNWVEVVAYARLPVMVTTTSSKQLPTCFSQVTWCRYSRVWWNGSTLCTSANTIRPTPATNISTRPIIAPPARFR